MTKTRRDTLSYSVVALFSAAMLFWGIPAFSPEYPGYGVPATTLPNLTCVMMLLLSLIGLARTLAAARKGDHEDAPGATVAWGHLARFLIPCLLLMPAMRLAGFIPAGVAFMLLVQVFCGQRRPVPLILVAAVPVLVLYALMRFGLGVPMP